MAGSGMCFLVGGHRGRGWGKKSLERRKRNLANAANPVSLTPKWDRLEID